MASLPFYQSFYPGKVVYYSGFAAASLFVLSFFIPLFFTLALVLLLITGMAVLVDAIFLFLPGLDC